MISHILMTCEYFWPLIYFENTFANEKKYGRDKRYGEISNIFRCIGELTSNQCKNQQFMKGLHGYSK